LQQFDGILDIILIACRAVHQPQDFPPVDVVIILREIPGKWLEDVLER